MHNKFTLVPSVCFSIAAASVVWFCPWTLPNLLVVRRMRSMNVGTWNIEIQAVVFLFMPSFLPLPLSSRNCVIHILYYLNANRMPVFCVCARVWVQLWKYIRHHQSVEQMKYFRLDVEYKHTMLSELRRNKYAHQSKMSNAAAILAERKESSRLTCRACSCRIFLIMWRSNMGNTGNAGAQHFGAVFVYRSCGFSSFKLLWFLCDFCFRAITTLNSLSKWHSVPNTEWDFVIQMRFKRKSFSSNLSLLV